MTSLRRIVMRPVGAATAFARLRPDFLLIGAMRCGTTTLYRYLRAHPHVRVASRKEVHYFDRHYDRGERWYLGHFPLILERWKAERRGVPLVTGEFTPGYLYHPLAAERVKATVPDARFLLLFRNPVDRAYSHYQRSRRVGREERSFEEAIEEEARDLGNGGVAAPESPFAYLSKGLYADQLRAWFQHFPRDRFLFLRSEELRDAVGTCREVSRFLEIPDFAPPRPARGNVGSYDPMSAETRTRLRRLYRPHNEALYALVGIDFGWE
jgi:hypothetical protein